VQKQVATISPQTTGAGTPEQRQAVKESRAIKTKNLPILLVSA